MPFLGCQDVDGDGDGDVVGVVDGDGDGDGDSDGDGDGDGNGDGVGDGDGDGVCEGDGDGDGFGDVDCYFSTIYVFCPLHTHLSLVIMSIGIVCIIRAFVLQFCNFALSLGFMFHCRFYI